MGETSGVKMVAVAPDAENYALILEVTRRERDLTISRANSNQTRAGILIGASGILGGTQLSGGLHGGDWVVLVSYLLAALTGVVVMLPRGMNAQPIERLYAMRAALPTIELRQLILVEEIRADGRAARLTTWRSFAVTAGFVVLVVGWLCSAVVLGADTPDEVVVVRLTE